MNDVPFHLSHGITAIYLGHLPPDSVQRKVYRGPQFTAETIYHEELQRIDLPSIFGGHLVPGRRRTMFSMSLWSVHIRNLADSNRTNNQVEAQHRPFRSLSGRQQPNIFRLKQEQIRNASKMED